MKHIVITGAAGFIGFHAALALLQRDTESLIIGVDNLNPYYDPLLKKARLDQLKKYPNFVFYALDIGSSTDMQKLRSLHPHVTHVLNLAAQAGVRHSLTHPMDYVHSNLVGFVEILEACRRWSQLEHLVYASSSSVYGANTQYPFSVQDVVRTPLSLYAATKQSNELMAYAYHHAFSVSCTGLRFFTVYGPWGRPDMAIFMFTKALMEDTPLTVFNQGNMWRSFTYISDIITGVLDTLFKPLPITPSYQIFNLGSSNMHSVQEVISILEGLTGKSARIHHETAHIMDVPKTHAALDQQDLVFTPKTSLQTGLEKFVQWYKAFYLGE
jgi:UDP-glucuronate 4-epimerase